MKSLTPIYVSSIGGFIVCFKGEEGRIFSSCSASLCLYSRDLHTAKLNLDGLEQRKALVAQSNKATPLQRKTTLKWNADGELSEIDKARILERLSNPSLTECQLACDLDKTSSSILTIS